jgi:GTP-binding protein Era
VAIVGRPNVGKSTLLNAALEQPLAIVTSTPQTTRDTILGVVHVGNAELALLDTPGLHKAESALSRAMNRSARTAARSADVVVFVTDLPPAGKARGALRPHPGDLALLADLAEGQPTVLVINKVDQLKEKGALLPLIDALSKVRAFVAIVPISAKREDGVRRVLDEVAKLVPEGAHRFEPDDITDRPTRFFAAEYVREQVLLSTREEVPHATAVTIEAFEEKARVMRIAATIHVERPGQKKILVGARGEMLKDIGTRARLRIEELIGCPVFLELFVRVTPEWRESPPLLAELGYADGEERRSDGETGATR